MSVRFLTYAYYLPKDEDRVVGDAIAWAYLTVVKEYPSVIRDGEELEVRAGNLCRRLEPQNSDLLTNEYHTFCKYFIACYTAAYTMLVRICDAQGREILQDLQALLDSLPEEIVVDMLRHIVLQSIRTFGESTE